MRDCDVEVLGASAPSLSTDGDLAVKLHACKRRARRTSPRATAWALDDGQTLSIEWKHFQRRSEGSQLPPQIARGRGRVLGLFGPNDDPVANTWSPARFCVTTARNAATSGRPEWGWHFSRREVQVRSWSSEEAKWAMRSFRALMKSIDRIMYCWYSGTLAAGSGSPAKSSKALRNFTDA